MTDHDSATSFTLAYLNLLEHNLKVTWNDAGVPICVFDWITDESIAKLRADLAELIEGDLDKAARQVTAQYGQHHVQTVGFGLAPDFEQFVKLGMIYGERVVLWDVIYSRILAGNSPETRKHLIAEIACQLLMLKAVVERGGVVLLAHPITWSPKAAQIDTELRSNGHRSAASVGLSMAFAAIEEGLALHPYTLLSDRSRQQVASLVEDQDHELFSRENFKFQQCLTTLLQDERMAYLENVPTEAFYDVVSQHNTLRRAIRQHFLPALGGLSPQQAREETRALVDDLFDLFEKRNTALIEYAAEGADATSAFVVASVSAAVLGQPLLSALAALGAPAMALSTAVRKWASKPPKDVIIQAFSALEESEAESHSYDPADIEHQIAAIQSDLSSLNDHYKAFMSYHWTEDRHHFLTTLSPEIAKEVLSLLRPEDIDRIVNERERQHDYIGDYLVYISDLDEDIYWAHLTASFDSPEGLLIYDDDANVESMQYLEIPFTLWQKLLGSLFSVYRAEMESGDYNFPLLRFPEIVRFQTTRTDDKDEKRTALTALANSLEGEQVRALMTFLNKAFDGKIPDWFTSDLHHPIASMASQC